MLYRVFPWLPGVPPAAMGGPLYVPRVLQGTGRYDNPDRYGALYASRSVESAVAERIQAFRGRVFSDGHLQYLDGKRDALAAINDEALPNVLDLDDPHALAARSIKPSMVATRRRETTQAIATEIFDEELPGFEWWSTLEASWTNVTLFAERAQPKLSLARDPEILSVDHPALRAAAEHLGIGLP